MNRTNTRLALLWARAACAFAVLVCLLAPPAQGGIVGTVEVTASSGADSGTVDIDVPLSGIWHPLTPKGIVDASGNVLGSVSEITLTADSDPSVSLGFFVTAGASTTTFTISSPVVSFAPLVNQQGVATAGVTLTDGNSDGASSFGLFPADKAYEAVYNGSTVFADLVSPVSAAPDSSMTTSERFPAVGTVLIGGPVTSIQSQFHFTLTANDLASGTSNFRVTPEPSSLVLALVGALALLWRERRRWF
ncbi:MAG: PEP-CTERM sorting domain-containing protein [Planctomycetia bacterium]|nr:PEP-CTERM sorting domain-containing protein [Planctomycetia bacterium]